jgi:hypothetical protein
MGGGWATLTGQTACDALREAGVKLSPEQVRVEARGDRWLVILPANRLAWFAANGRGRERLEVERRVLRLLAERCSFGVPRTLFESDHGWEIRAVVPGFCDPSVLFKRTRSDIPLARRIGRAIGSILAEQHSNVSYAHVEGWLPTKLAWPMANDWIRRRLPGIVDDRGLLAEIDNALNAFDDVGVTADDCVLVHGDLGFHNIVFDPETFEVRGLFDFADASWADRHHDFRYLLFDHERDDTLEAALDVYEPAVGRTLDRDRIRLYNAACAICFLALRQGIPPEQRSCGRTLAEDLHWVRGALARL